MTHPKAGPTTPAPPGWRIFTSDAGRLWATREEPFSAAADKAGAWRTVDADDELALAREIAEQESIADLSGQAS